MSRREERSSESKRHRSRFDRDPCPKKSRREGKPENERPPAEPDLDKDRPDRDHRHHRRLQDPLPLESGTMSKESENGADGLKGVAPTKVPQSRSYFQQHDDRGYAGKNGRGFSRRTDSEHGWWHDPKEQQNDLSTDKTASAGAQQKNEKSKNNREGTHARRRDGYFEMEANPKPPARRRPAFREQKIPADPEKTNRAADDLTMTNPQDHATGSGRRNERGYNHRYSDRPERPVAGGREFKKAGNFSSGDRYGGNSRYRGRDRFNARQGYQPTGGHADKWKHDLYDEANKSPPPKNEEDQISKIESLLAS